MTYTIKFSDTTKASFTIADLKKDGPGSLDGTHTDLVLYGKQNSDYGEDLWNNLVHILENFSSPGPGPAHPIEGQLWYNKVDGVLSVYKEILPSTSPKTYEWSKLIDVKSLSNANVINELLTGLATALADPSNTSKTAFLTALGNSYLLKAGGTLTGPLNINPYTTDATNDPLQNDNLAVSVSYLKNFVNNKIANIDLSTLIGFDIPPFDGTLDAGTGGYYLKKVLDASLMDGSLNSAQLSQANIILPSYNADIVNNKFAASREYVDLKIQQFSQTLVKRIIWSDTLNLSNSLLRGTLTAKLPTGFNFVALPTITISPVMAGLTTVINLDDAKELMTISFTGTSTATRLLSKISIATSQITGVAGYIDADSLNYSMNVVATGLTTTMGPTTTTTSTPTTVAPSTTTTTAPSSTTTTSAPTTATPTTAAPSTPTLFEGGYWFGSDATYNYYVSPNNLEPTSRVRFSDAVTYCNGLPVSGNSSYKWEVASVAVFTLLYNYQSHLSSVCSFSYGYWTTDMDSSNYWKKIFLMSDGSTTNFNPSNSPNPDDNTILVRPIRKVPK